jgi:tetratricopeptide (TPR) repeat protein
MTADDCIARGRAALEHGKREEARGLFERAAELEPASSGAQFHLGVVSAESGRDAEALAHYERCLALGGGGAGLHHNIGAAQARLGRTEDAEASYRRALREQRDHPEACAALGRLLQERGEFDAALELYERAARDGRRGYQAAFHKSQILLARGDLRQGFKWYASRPNRLFSAERRRLKLFRGSLPRELGGATVLVLSERTGIGEDLFFARFFPLLKGRGARLVFRCGARARRLLEGAACVDEFVERVAERASPAYALFAGDLPYALEIWEQEHLPAGGDEGEWIPLFKRVPPDALGRRVRALGGTLVALQRRVDEAELAQLGNAAGARAVDLSARTAELDATLAIAAALDHYICVPNTHLHLRLAARRTAAILEPFPPDWRLELDGPGSRWYPGCRVYRQDNSGSWDAALAQLAEDLPAAR